MNKTKSQHKTTFSLVQPTTNGDPSYFELYEKNPENKLNQKIQKLKNSLNSTEKHNEQLHQKIKVYKEQLNQVKKQIAEASIIKASFEQLSAQHNRTIRQLEQIRMRLNLSQNQNKKLQKKYSSILVELKNKQMKIVQLQGIKKDLQDINNEKCEQIKKLQGYPVKEKIKQMNSKFSKIQLQLELKNSQSVQYKQQIWKLKNSFKSCSTKFQKSNILVFELTKKNKQLEEQVEKKIITLQQYQKQKQHLKEETLRVRTEGKEREAKMGELEKQLLQMEFQKKQQIQKFVNVQESFIQLKTEKLSLQSKCRILEEQYQAHLLLEYDKQSEFERELHTIVKQLNRRKIVSKNFLSL